MRQKQNIETVTHMRGFLSNKIVIYDLMLTLLTLVTGIEVKFLTQHWNGSG